jgi:hypothetical protein
MLITLVNSRTAKASSSGRSAKAPALFLYRLALLLTHASCRDLLLARLFAAGIRLATGVGVPPFVPFIDAVVNGESLSAFASKDGPLRTPIVFEAEKA